MNVQTVIEAGLKGGLVGLYKTWLDEVLEDANPKPEARKQLKLSVKYAPLMDRIINRVIKIADHRENLPVTIEDHVFKRQCTSFIQMYSVCEEVLYNHRGAYNESSAWLIFSGDAETSSYFTLEVRSKDGKKVRASTTINLA